MSSELFDTIEPIDVISWEELKNSLLLISVTGLEDNVPTKHTKPGEKSPAVRADVVVLDGDLKDTVYHDALIFPVFLQVQLRRRVGKKPTLARLYKDDRTWKLSVDITEDDVKLATNWIQQKPSDIPF